MDMPQVLPRPDVDIAEEIGTVSRSYAPLKASRNFFTYEVRDGAVTVSGNVNSPQSRRMLLESLPRIDGVKSVAATQLYDDETLRLAIGNLLPDGVFANVLFGSASLTGNLPSTTPANDLINAVRAVPGVRRVGAEWSTPEDATAPR